MSWIPDQLLVDFMDRFVSGENSIEIIEEDGGVIVICRSHRVQNSYVGRNLRDALTEALDEEAP